MPPSEIRGQQQLGDAVARSSAIAGLTVVAVAVLVLFGWLTGNSLLTRLHPDLATMKPNTALCLLLCGLALWSTHNTQPVPLRRWAGRAAALIAALIAGATLLEYITDTSFGIDQLLFTVNSGLH